MGLPRRDRSVHSTNTPTQTFSFKPIDRGVYRCIVMLTNYVDDANNLSKGSNSPEVTYDVVIIGGLKEGQLITNCRVAGAFGGQYNYSERIFRNTTKKIGGAGALKLENLDGDIVYVMFQDGDTAYPLIIGGGNHQLDQDKTGASKADGHRLVEEYNGIKTLINKDGELTITRKGGSWSDTFFNPATGSPEATLSFIKDVITLKDTEDNSLTFTKSAKKVEIIAGKDAITDTLDGTAESITRKFKSGLIVLEDGKNDMFKITTAGGLVATFDGKTDKITFLLSGGSKIEADGAGKTIKITAVDGSASIEIDGNSGQIKLIGNLVDLGKSVSDFAVLGTKLLTAFNTHVHQFIDLTPIPVTSVTFPPTAPMPISVLSQTVKVQS